MDNIISDADHGSYIALICLRTNLVNYFHYRIQIISHYRSSFWLNVVSLKDIFGIKVCLAVSEETEQSPRHPYLPLTAFPLTSKHRVEQQKPQDEITASCVNRGLLARQIYSLKSVPGVLHKCTHPGHILKIVSRPHRVILKLKRLPTITLQCQKNISIYRLLLKKPTLQYLSSGLLLTLQ